ncbi:MAG: histidine phosphatase family protein [Coprobacillus sp.]
MTRHSQTVWNEEKRLQGRQDSPLTQKGVENALALKKHIINMSFDYIYASSILRAYKTASLLFDEHDIIKDERLLEMNFGVFEGLKISDIQSQSNLYYQLWNQPEQFDRIPNGESYDEVIKRAKSFLEDLKKLKESSQVFIVTHGMFFIVLLATMLGMDKKDFVKLNQEVAQGCSLTLINYENDKFSIEFYNKHDFLPNVSNTLYAK